MTEDMQQDAITVATENKGNEGINKYTFCIGNSILESRYELPDIISE